MSSPNKASNLKRLASLCAVGAGALASVPSTAFAAPAWVTVDLTTPVPAVWSPWPRSTAVVALPDIPTFTFRRFSYKVPLNSSVAKYPIRVDVRIIDKPGNFLGAPLKGDLNPNNPDLTGLSLRTKTTLLPVERVFFWGGGKSSATTQGTGTTYVFFQFGSREHPRIGWLKLNLTATASTAGAGSGPEASISAYGYQTPKDGSGLDALALGAAGMRQWRAARK